MRSFLLDVWDTGLDDTDGNGSLHVSDGESTKRWELSEGLNTHWLGGSQGDNSTVTGLDELGFFLEFGTRSSVHLVLDLLKLASNMSSMAIKDRGVTVMDLTRVTKDDDLSIEGRALFGSVRLGV